MTNPCKKNLLSYEIPVKLLNMSNLSNPRQWVDLYADDLYAYTIKIIPDTHQAENLIQETFLAALKAKESFKGNSAEKTWLIGILRHKITDYLRSKYKEIPVSNLAPDDVNVDSFFDQVNQSLKNSPGSWDINPSQLLNKEEFWRAFEECLKRLPKKTAAAFSLSELDEMKSKEICKVLNVSATNLWSLLHRARIQLRQCLQINWFEHEK